MASGDRLLARILRGTSDASIPFGRFCALLRSLGFDERGNATHGVDVVAALDPLNLQPKKGKAKVYQVRQVRNIVLTYKLAGDRDD